MQHPFEIAGFKAPYHFVGAHEKVHVAGDHCQAAGTCDVCGTCYRYGADFQDSQGVHFSTGLICAAKSLLDYGDLTLAQEVKTAHKELMRKIRNDKWERAEQERKQAQKERAELDVQTFRTTYGDEEKRRLSTIGHPLNWRRERGDSWADAVQYWIDNGNFRRAGECLNEGLQAFEDGTGEPLVIIPKLCPSDAARHLGAPKERITIEGVVRFKTSFEGAYGFVYLYKIATTDGQLVGVKTSSPLGKEVGDQWHGLSVGDSEVLTGTVKSHDTDKYEEYRPITWIQRCKVGAPKVKAPKKPRASKPKAERGKKAKQTNDSGLFVGECDTTIIV